MAGLGNMAGLGTALPDRGGGGGGKKGGKKGGGGGKKQAEAEEEEEEEDEEDPAVSDALLCYAECPPRVGAMLQPQRGTLFRASPQGRLAASTLLHSEHLVSLLPRSHRGL